MKYLNNNSNIIFVDSEIYNFIKNFYNEETINNYIVNYNLVEEIDKDNIKFMETNRNNNILNNYMLFEFVDRKNIEFMNIMKRYNISEISPITYYDENVLENEDTIFIDFSELKEKIFEYYLFIFSDKINFLDLNRKNNRILEELEKSL